MLKSAIIFLGQVIVEYFKIKSKSLSFMTNLSANKRNEILKKFCLRGYKWLLPQNQEGKTFFKKIY